MLLIEKLFHMCVWGSGRSINQVQELPVCGLCCWVACGVVSRVCVVVLGGIRVLVLFAVRWCSICGIVY